MLPALLRLMDYRFFKGRKGPEDAISIDVATMLRVATIEGRLKATWTHVPHEVGGGRGVASQVRYALAKAMGLISGSADFVFVWPDGGAWIELKTPTGSLNPAQKDFRAWCEGTSSRYAVCRSVEAVENLLIEWGVLQSSK